MRNKYPEKLQVKDFDSTLSEDGTTLSYKDVPLPFAGGKLYLIRDICGSVPINELVKFPFPLYSTLLLPVDEGYIPYQENYFVILQSFDSSLKSYIRYQDPDPSAVNVDDFNERQGYMLAMQSIVQNSPNYTLTNNQNDENQLECNMSFGSFDLRPKIFDSFDIEWTSTGQIYGEILKEADNIIGSLEFETKNLLGLMNDKTFN